jgi:uracil-DNA glycosylase
MDIPADWAAALAPFLDRWRWAALCERVAVERTTSAVFPPGALALEALRRTPFARVRVALVGQDPYHGRGQATGLAFAVPPGVAPPPSLVNLFAELRADRGIAPPGHGWLGAWAERGVLLLNTTLTVREDAAGSHHALGWECLVDAVLDALAARPEPVVFALLGGPARKKAIRLGDRAVVEVAHPSPLSWAAFSGCRLFSRIDAALGAPFDWTLPADPGPGPALEGDTAAAVAALAPDPPVATLRHLLALPMWERCSPAERLAIARAVERVLPARFSLVSVDGLVARFSFDDPDRGPRAFCLVPGGAATLGRDPRKAKLSPALRARFEKLWGQDVDAWLAERLSPPRTAALEPLLVEAEEALAAEPLVAGSPARDLDRTGRIAASLARDGLRLPSPDEAEWALAAGGPRAFSWPDPRPVSAFGVPWPVAPELTSDPDRTRCAAREPDPTTRAGWTAALGWSPAAFEAPGPDTAVRRVRPIFPYNRRGG